jgi:1,4-alpha-glucan branching enzyme
MTCAVPELPVYEIMEGVHVHRIHMLQSLTPVTFIDWVFQMNLAFTDYIVSLADQGIAFDLIHAHDWMVYYSAKQSKQALRIPLIATIHATESGRNQGALHSDLQHRIHGLETKLTAAADRIITCSRSMTLEVGSLFALPSSKILTIPNGVDFNHDPNIQQLLPTKPLQEALQQTKHERILCFMGRLVQEKGIHILIEAMTLVLPAYPSGKLLIAGVGPMMDQLKEQAAPLGDRIQFVGFLNETDKNILLQHAELCIFPSLYEPFGIVALEAMSRCIPVIVSDVGGLGEIIEHGIDGCKVTPGDAFILAKQITALLNEPEYGKQLAASAVNKVKLNYNWPSIGADTAKAYYELTSKSS